MILEKTQSLASLGITNGTQASDQISGGGGNTHISGGLCVWPTDPVAGAQHLYSLSFGTTPMDVCEAWGTMANQNKAWLDSMGIPCTLASMSGEFPNVPGYFLDQQLQRERARPAALQVPGRLRPEEEPTFSLQHPGHGPNTEPDDR